MTICGALVSVSMIGGCASDLERQVGLLTQENEDLRVQLAGRNDDLAQTRQELRDKESELAGLHQAPLAQVTGFEQIPGVTASVSGGEVTVAVESDVLFDSGKTSLKAAAKSSLSSVVSVLNRSYDGRGIRVEGHTDTDPIRKSGHKSNYHLGFERAYAVREYLIKQGVDEGRIALSSYGPHRPLGSKPASRRVEIVVMMEE
jgi:outer membrane protein OmpA-like peptidoglycan-associated protein